MRIDEVHDYDGLEKYFREQAQVSLNAYFVRSGWHHHKKAATAKARADWLYAIANKMAEIKANGGGR